MFPDRSPRLKRDPGLVGASLARTADQLRDGLAQASRARLPAWGREIRQVVIAGMGGSHLGADIALSALEGRLLKPVVVASEYWLPGWVNSSTLVICSSYSGNTEETLSALQVAKQRRAKIVVITTGGRLATQARKLKLPLVLIKPTENPSRQPRLGVAYSLAAMLVVWKKLGIIRLGSDELAGLSVGAWEAIKRYGPTQPAKKNPAKQLATSWLERRPLLVGGSWATGNLHTFANQIHENAKTYAAWAVLPELNHHLMEGLRNRSVAKQFHALFVEDVTHQPTLKRRFTLTQKIFRDLGIRVSRFTPRGALPLDKAIDLLVFGGYVSWYLSIAENVDPAPIPTVDELKEKLRA